MLVLLTFTMMVAAPIMCVGGIVLALRQDVALSALAPGDRAGADPRRVTLIIARMRPQFRSMQEPHRPGQPGAARADHRHPGDPRLRPRRPTSSGASAARTPNSPTSRSRVGRLMALMFPTVMLVINVVQRRHALVRRGIASTTVGMQIGALTAFLSLPHADPVGGHDGHLHVRHAAPGRGLRRADRGGARHRVRRWCRRPSRSPSCAEHGLLDCDGVEFRYPGARGAGAARRRPRRPTPARSTAVIGSTGAGKTTLVNLIPRLFDVTGGAVLVDGVDVRQLDAGRLSRDGSGWCRRSRTCSRGTVAIQPAIRPPRRHRRGALARPGGRSGPRLRRGDARRARRADRAGRQQRLGRAAAAAGHCPRAGPPAGDLPVR